MLGPTGNGRPFLLLCSPFVVGVSRQLKRYSISVNKKRANEGQTEKDKK